MVFHPSRSNFCSTGCWFCSCNNIGITISSDSTKPAAHNGHRAICLRQFWRSSWISSLAAEALMPSSSRNWAILVMNVVGLVSDAPMPLDPLGSWRRPAVFAWSPLSLPIPRTTGSPFPTHPQGTQLGPDMDSPYSSFCELSQHTCQHQRVKRHTQLPRSPH